MVRRVTANCGLLGDAFGRDFHGLLACARVHGAAIGLSRHDAWRQVEAAMTAQDVLGGESWAFHKHRTMAEVTAEEETAA